MSNDQTPKPPAPARALRGPRLHLFVCANRREAGSPLGPGCSNHGDIVYDAFKAEVQARGLIASVWITKTHCLGICPKRGATVARYSLQLGASPQTPPRSADSQRTRTPASRARGPAPILPILTEVTPDHVGSLLSFDEHEQETATAKSPTMADVVRELDALSELQRKKVLDLARRLKPGLTLEDIQNPHDFPELDDSDWHYADGVLTGIASVQSALAALASRSRDET